MSVVVGNEEVRSVERGVVEIDVAVTFGATGAVSSTDVDEAAVTVTRATTGRYTFTFAHSYAKFLNVIAVADTQGTVVDGHYDIYTGYASSAISLSYVVAGSEADPASGTVHHYTFRMQASSRT